jgi:RimJ/RimL family protein N-acetyltransferase
MDKKYLPAGIESEIIHLNKLDEGLAPQMFNYICEDRDRLNRFLPWPQYIHAVEDEIGFIRNSSDAWEKHESANYGIFRNADKEYMGNIGIFNLDWNNESCEMGYWILGKFEGKGYIRDSVGILEREIFSLGFNRIVIMCEDENNRSKKIPMSLGYSFEGVLREYKKENDKFVSREVYSKLKREYAELKTS